MSCAFLRAISTEQIHNIYMSDEEKRGPPQNQHEVKPEQSVPTHCIASPLRTPASLVNPRDEANVDYSTDTSTDDGTDMPYFPLPLMYVTVRLDPVGSVASLEDEAATLIASRIPTKTYVGHVGDVCPLCSS